MIKTKQLFIGKLLLLFSFATYTNLKSQTWAALGSSVKGTNGTVSVMEVYNNKLIVGGTFNTAGTVIVNNIAQWDGSNWSNPFGMGLTSQAANIFTNAMVVYNNELIVAGSFTNAGSVTAKGLARWNGTSWSSFSPTIEYFNIFSMAVLNNELYVAGTFSMMGGISANNIAKWNGTTWSSLGPGLSTNVTAIKVYNGELYASGNFGNGYLAKWNGTSWLPIGMGLPSYGYSFEIYNSELYIPVAIGNPYLYKTDGTTVSFVPTTQLTYSSSPVKKLVNYNNTLVMSGASTSVVFSPSFNMIGPPTTYNGSSFLDIPIDITANNQINELVVYNSELYACWTYTGDVDPFNNIARFQASVNINETSDDETITIYPNPTRGWLNIEISMDKGSEATITIENMIGQELYTTKITQEKTTVSTSNLNAGVYFVRVKTAKGSSVEKVVIE